MDILTHPKVRITIPGGHRGFVDLPSTADTDLPVPDGCLLMMDSYDDSEEPYCMLKKEANEEVEVEGSHVSVISHIGTDPVVLSFHKVWSVEDDPELVKFREKRLGDERRAYENQFVRGAKFRIVKAGANISGMVPIAPYTQQGFREELAVGTILQCAGSSMTFGDGVPAIKWLREDGKYICNDAVFSHVQGGMWSGQYPAPGWMELVAEVPQ